MENMPKILVIGDIMLDVYINGTVERVSPEAPVPVLKFEKQGAKIVARQELSKTYHKNGLVYAMTRQCIIEQKEIFGKNIPTPS